MSAQPSPSVVELDAGHLPAWTELFVACGCDCYCRYWHFEGPKNEWLARCAHEPEKNRAEQVELVRSTDPRARGLLALGADRRALGWMKVAPRAILPKLRRLPVYRALDLGDDRGVWSIACFLVLPGARKGGVARALVRAAQARLAGWGGTALEAYPRRTSEPMHDEEAWMGPLGMFVAEGFVPHHDEGPYPVLRWRRTLGDPEA